MPRRARIEPIAPRGILAPPPVLPMTPRPEQEQVIREVLKKIDEGNSKFVLRLPCGFGKSVIAAEIQHRLNVRAIICTISHELMAQYHGDFSYMYPLLGHGKMCPGGGRLTADGDDIPDDSDDSDEDRGKHPHHVPRGDLECLWDGCVFGKRSTPSIAASTRHYINDHACWTSDDAGVFDDQWCDGVVAMEEALRSDVILTTIHKLLWDSRFGDSFANRNYEERVAHRRTLLVIDECDDSRGPFDDAMSLMTLKYERLTRYGVVASGIPKVPGELRNNHPMIDILENIDAAGRAAKWKLLARMSDVVDELDRAAEARAAITDEELAADTPDERRKALAQTRNDYADSIEQRAWMPYTSGGGHQEKRDAVAIDKFLTAHLVGGFDRLTSRATRDYWDSEAGVAARGPVDRGAEYGEHRSVEWDDPKQRYTSHYVSPAKAFQSHVARKHDITIMMSGSIAKPGRFAATWGYNPEDTYTIWRANPFPVASRPIYYWQQSESMSASFWSMHQHGGNEWTSWVLTNIATLIETFRVNPATGARERTLVHVSSGEQSQMLAAFLPDAITYPNGNSDAKSAAIDKYLATPDGLLVAQGMRRGVDFRDDECRAQIVVKTPFTPRDRHAVARDELEPGSYDEITVSETVQMVARGMRGPDDWCRTLVVDKGFGWLMSKAGVLPDDVLEAVTFYSWEPAPFVRSASW